MEAAAWCDWVLRFPLALPGCPLLAPWRFSDLGALADLGRGSAPAYSYNGGGEKGLFISNRIEGGSLLFLGGVISISKK